jgi:hypothetical protein
LDWTTEGDGEGALELEEDGDGEGEGVEAAVSCNSATVTMAAADVELSDIGEVVAIVELVGRRGMDDVVGVGIVADSIGLVDAVLSAASTPLD